MTKAIDYATRVTCASDNMEEFTAAISAMLRAEGIPHSPAQKDKEGRCLTCGLIWLCPGVHTFEEIQEAARRERVSKTSKTVEEVTP